MRTRRIKPRVWKPGESRGHDGRGSELGNRNVIGVPVSAVGSKRDDDVGLYPPQMFHNGGDNLTLIRKVEVLVVIVQQGDFADNPRRSGGAQLRLTDVRQRG